MRSKLAARCLGLGVLALITCEANGFAAATWFNQRVTWKYGKEGLEWKTIIRDPHGQRGYLLALRPLWAVEGASSQWKLSSDARLNRKSICWARGKRAPNIHSL